MTVVTGPPGRSERPEHPGVPDGRNDPGGWKERRDQNERIEPGSRDARPGRGRRARAPIGRPWWPRSGALRLLAAATLVNAAGNGLFTVGSMLFFTHHLGLGATAVAAGLTAAELTGLACSVPAGLAADRLGARPVLQAAWLLQAAATGAFLLSRSMLLFVPVAVGYAIGQKAARGVTNALVARSTAQGDRVVVRSYLRSVNNLGLSAGSLLGGLAVVTGTGSAYEALFAADAGTFAIAIVLLAYYRAPIAAPIAAPAAMPAAARPAGGPAVRDRRYLLLTAGNGLLCLQYSVLTVVLPLWIVDHTAAPRWTASALLALNTAMVVLFQVRMSRPIDSGHSAARYLRRAGSLFLISVTAIGTASYGSAWIAVLLLLFGTAVHTVAELWHAAASFEASLELADPDRPGEYQAVFSLGQGLAEALAPTLLVALCLDLGVVGWLVVAVLLTLGGIAMSSLLARSPSGTEHDEVIAHAPATRV